MSGDFPLQGILFPRQLPPIYQSFQHDGVFRLCGHAMARILLINITNKRQACFLRGAIDPHLKRWHMS